MTNAPHVHIIGGGPAGLIAAETLANAQIAVTLHDRMPSLARKFLMAGHGGLNLTNSEPLDSFIAKYSSATDHIEKAIRAFTPENLRAWCEDLGQETFVGTSGRIFPKAMKASPLLRAWLGRLEKLGVRFALRHRFLGWNEKGDLLFEGSAPIKADATLLALGGASWPHLGSDGKWANFLGPAAPFEAANGGFTVPWTPHFAERFAGQPLKPVTLLYKERKIQGEVMLTQKGIEGGPVYALSGALRETIKKDGEAVLTLDLRPGLSEKELLARLHKPRGSQSLSTFLRKAGGLSPQAIGLVREVCPAPPNEPEALAALIKKLPLRLSAVGPIERAISSAGGLKLESLDENFMLRDRPSVFAAGEMLDWDAPTGGYLLQACFSTGIAAAKGIIRFTERLA